MCRRFGLFKLERFIEAHLRNMHVEVRQVRDDDRYRVATTDLHPVIRRLDDKLVMDELSWGYDHPIHKKRVVHARAETIHTGMFGASFRTRRCLAPASGYYEGKQPHFIRLKSQETFCFAGVWQNDRFAIATCEPNELVKPLRDRMPVILRTPDQWQQWLDRPAKELLVPVDPALMEAYPVENFGLRDSPLNIQPIQTLF